MSLRMFLDRYGIAIAVVVGLVATIALLPGNAGRRDGGPGDIDLSAGSDDGGLTDAAAERVDPARLDIRAQSSVGVDSSFDRAAIVQRWSG